MSSLMKLDLKINSECFTRTGRFYDNGRPRLAIYASQGPHAKDWPQPNRIYYIIQVLGSTRARLLLTDAYFFAI